MEHFLITTNQWFTFGVNICDDTTNLNRKLVIEASEYLFIPMQMEGSTYGLIPLLTTDNELHKYQHILLSD